MEHLNEPSPSDQAQLNIAHTLGGNIVSLCAGYQSATVLTALAIAMSFVLAKTTDNNEDALGAIEDIYDELINGVERFEEIRGR